MDEMLDALAAVAGVRLCGRCKTQPVALRLGYRDHCFECIQGPCAVVIRCNCVGAGASLEVAIEHANRTSA